MKRVLLIAVCLLGGLTANAVADDLDAGKTLYTANCQKCHGANGQGGVGKKLVGDASKWEFTAFKNAVLNGLDDEGHKLKQPMPLFGKVGLTDPKGKVPDDTDLQNVYAYIKTLSGKKG
jgi:mono/diheme cytochrome c family protein